MRSIEFSFENPWLLLAALPALALILLFCRRMRRAPGAPRPERWALALRVAEAALAVLILAQVSLTSYTARRQTIVLADRSDSMAGSQEAVEDCLALMAELAGEEQPLQVMDFAASWGPLRQPQDPAASLNGSATDLEAALTAAAGSFSPNGGKRIVLLTDGVPTDGSVEAALEHLEGIRVDVIPLDGWAEAPEAQLTSLELPAGAAEGQRVTANVTALSNETSPAQLSIYDGDALAYQEQVSLVPGENRFSCSLTAGAAGSHTYRAELVSQADTLPQNNWGYALLNVNQGVEILIVDGTGDQSPKLQQLLTQAGYAVTCLPSGQMPSTVTDLCAYGLVILMNVDARDLPEGSAENLEAYVSEYGRGVLTTGGENTYFYGNMAGTAFERFLPVDILIQQTQSVDPIALLLVIDVTDSMTRQSLGVPIEMARRSAVKCVNALNSNDYVGVITFSDEAQVLMEMTTVQDKAAVIQAIEGIQTVGPEHLTKFTGALSAAYSQLASFQQLDRKHVLFITDGNPSDKDFEGIVRDMKAQGITLSTIAVGKLNTVVELLQELAAIGGGRCYMVESAYDLPDIVTMDTALLQVDYTIRQPFTPLLSDPAFPVSAQSAPTLLFACVRAQAKSQATVALASPDGQPVYAVWDYGAGRSASFMSDLSGDWSNNWFTNAPGQRMILDMVEALIPGTVDRKALELTLEAGGVRGLLSLKGSLGQVDQVSAQVLSPQGASHTAILQKTGENQFAREIPLDQPGLYTVTLRWQDEAGEQTRESAVAYAWSREYDVLQPPENQDILLDLCGSSGGAMFSRPEDLMGVELETTAVHHDLILPLSIALAACLILDIALRKIQPKGLPGLRSTASAGVAPHRKRR